MKRIVFVLGLVVLLYAQPSRNQHPTQFSYVFQTVPGAVPTSLTDVIAPCATGTGPSLTCLTPGTDAYICAGDATATGQTFTIQDKQPTPIPWITGALGSGSASATWGFATYDD